MFGFSVLLRQIIFASFMCNYGVSVCEALPTYLTNLFNMHKIKPMRSYKLYGAGSHDGPLDYDAGVPRIAQPSEFQTPEEMIKHLTGRQYAMQGSLLTQPGVNNYGGNNNVGETSRWSWLLPDYFRFASSPSSSSSSDRRRFKITSSVPDFPPSAASPYHGSEYLSSTKNLAEVSRMTEEQQSVVRTSGVYDTDVSSAITLSSREVANVNDNNLDSTI